LSIKLSDSACSLKRWELKKAVLWVFPILMKYGSA